LVLILVIALLLPHDPSTPLHLSWTPNQGAKTARITITTPDGSRDTLSSRYMNRLSRANILTSFKL
jgi:hypothetical protein